MSNNIPSEFLCPITQSIMTDPVMCGDGYTYERSAITQWLQSHSTSPMTRLLIDRNTIVTNRALKELITNYLANGSISGQNIAHNIAQNSGQIYGQTNINNVQQLSESDFTIFTQCITSPFNSKTYVYTTKKPTIQTNDVRLPITCVAIIDVSGSMDSLCSVSNGTSQVETDNLTRLDLTKYSIQTIMTMLNDNDTLVLIKFSDTAEKIFNGQMNQAGKALAKNVIANLTTQGSTNIWDALRVAYDHIVTDHLTNVKMLLLTDGEANINPPMGILPTFKKYLDRNTDTLKQSNVELTMFGFSYDVDSKLLFDISELVGSSFNFIPDASMVGTTFINYLSNSLNSSYEKHIVYPLDITTGAGLCELTDFDALSPESKYEIVRYHVYECLRDICLNTDDKTRNLKPLMTGIYTRLKNFIERLLSTDGCQSELLSELYKDFCSPQNQTNDEQITKALEREEWFKKWGYHYLLSLSTAHKVRKCHNFKDKGVQLYGNTLFSQLRDEINDIFCTLPPPKPSGRSYTYGGYNSYGLQQQMQRPASPINMSRYVNSGGGCFAYWCRIKLFNGSYKRLDELNSNDLLFTNASDENDASTAGRIKYIIKTKPINGSAQMCKIGDLYITEWHPVNHDGVWKWPNQITDTFNQRLDWYYNIILDQSNGETNAHSVIIENIECITMAHNIRSFDEQNSILEHSYFGTNQVTNDLERFIVNDQTSKIITVDNYVIVRDHSNLVCGILRL